MELCLENGCAVGTVSVQRIGEDTLFTVVSHLPQGLWRIVAHGTSGQLVLGVWEGGSGTMQRRFSRPLTERIGTVQAVTAQQTGARMESEWQACEEAVSGLPPLPPGTLWKRVPEGRMLAMPWADNAPFPWTPLFCLARVGAMNGRFWVFYTLDGKDRPVVPPKR